MYMYMCVCVYIYIYIYFYRYIINARAGHVLRMRPANHSHSSSASDERCLRTGHATHNKAEHFNVKRAPPGCFADQMTWACLEGGRGYGRFSSIRTPTNGPDPVLFYYHDERAGIGCSRDISL